MLFERAATGSTPTHFGRALEPHARAILNQAERAEHEIAELVGARRGRVRVMSGPIFADILYPTVLRRFHETHPKVQVSLATGYGENILAALRAREAEVAFTMLGPHAIDGAFATDILVENQSVIIVGNADHPLAKRRRVTPHEAWAYPWIMTRQPGLFRAMLLQRFARFDLPIPAPASECASAEIQKRLLRSGGYLASIAELAVREELSRDALREIRVPELNWTFAAGAFYLKSVPLTPAARHFINVARSVGQELAPKRKP
jgi:DNA-binding transcriptional LysR family regulator